MSSTKTDTPKNKSKYNCVCNWPAGKCEEIFQLVHENLDEQHPWKKQLYRFRTKQIAPDKASVFKATIFKCFAILPENQPKYAKGFYVAYHHFSIPLLQQAGHVHGWLSAKVISDIDKSIILHGKYSVSSLLGKSHMESIKNNKESLKKVEGMYARPPLVAWKEAIEVASKSTRDLSNSTRKCSSDPNRLSLSLARSLNEPTTPSPIFSSDKNTHEGLITEYNNSLKFTGKALEESQFVLLATNNISYCHSNKLPCQTVFQLAEGVFFNTCLSFPHPQNCLHFKLLTNYCVMSNFCNSCMLTEKNSNLRAKRKDEDVGNRGTISSKVKNSVLSPAAKLKKIASLTTVLKSTRRKLASLELKLENSKEKHMVTIEDTDTKSFIKDAFDHIATQLNIPKKNGTNKLQQEIIKVLVHCNLTGEDSMDENELSDFASRICLVLKQESKKLTGNKKGFRYDRRLKRIALSHYLEYGKQGYERLKQSSLEIMPSRSQNERDLAHIRGGYGNHCANFASQFADVLDSLSTRQEDPNLPKATVQLIFDEIKVKSGVAYNPKTGRTTGFTASRNGKNMNFAEEIMDIATDSLIYPETDDLENEDKIRSRTLARQFTVSNFDCIEKFKQSIFDKAHNSDDNDDDNNNNDYVGGSTDCNIWKIRTDHNQTYIIGYFFNCGDLDGDDVVRQLLIVITACEIVGLSVSWQMSDAGGANTRAAALLTDNRINKLGNGIPDKNCLRYCNPLSCDLWIWISLCAVHGLKAGRNSICNHDLYKDGLRISFKVLRDVYDHMTLEQETTLNVRGLRRLKRSAAYPDSYTKQNVGDAKQPFLEETINYECQMLADKMNVDSNFFDTVMKKYEQIDGKIPEMLDEKVEMLGAKILEIPDLTKHKEFQNELAFIEFSTVIHYIYIARLLNKHARLINGEESRKRDLKAVKHTIILSLNIDEEMKRMEKKIEYFEKWRDWAKNLPKNELNNNYGTNKWTTICLASVTLRNIKICNYSFLYRSKYALENNHKLKFVPMLHNNSSSLESTNCYLRSSHRDTATSLGLGIVATNISGMNELHTSSVSYSANDCVPENKNLYKSDYDVTLGTKKRAAWLKKLEEKRKKNLISAEKSNKPVAMFTPTFKPVNVHVAKIWKSITGVEEKEEHYSLTMLTDESFRDVAKAPSTHTPLLGEWFAKIIEGKMESEFDELCQKLNGKILQFLMDTAVEKAAKNTDAGKATVSYNIKLFNMCQDKTLLGIIKEDECTQVRKGVICILQILSQRMECKQREGLLNYHNKLITSKSMGNQDVNKIFGWAIYNLRLKKIKERDVKHIFDFTDEYIRCNNEVEFLSRMRTYFAQALLSQKYMETYYDYFLRSNNRGYLTLVHEDYFEFGCKLMMLVSQSLTQDLLHNNINASIEGKQMVMNNSELFEEFWEISQKHNNNFLKTKAQVKDIYTELIEKVVNAKYGEECGIFIANNTVRGGKLKENNLAFRGSIDAMSSKSKKNVEDKKRKR